MTTPKEALEKCAAALQLLGDERNVIRFTGKWANFGSITVADILDEAQSALTSLQGEDAVERVAGCICQNQHRRGYCTEPGCPYSTSDAVEKVKALAHRFWSIHPSTIAAMNLTREEFYVREMMALLATGLVPDEAAVRADEREKCAKIAEADASIREGSLQAEAGHRIALAIRGMAK